MSAPLGESCAARMNSSVTRWWISEREWFEERGGCWTVDREGYFDESHCSRVRYAAVSYPSFVYDTARFFDQKHISTREGTINAGRLDSSSRMACSKARIAASSFSFWAWTVPR